MSSAALASSLTVVARSAGSDEVNAEGSELNGRGRRGLKAQGTGPACAPTREHLLHTSPPRVTGCRVASCMSASPARYCMDASSLEPPRSPALYLQRPHPTAVTASTSQDPLFRTRYALSAYACTTLPRGWHVPVLPPVPLFAPVAHRAHPALKAPSPAKRGGPVARRLPTEVRGMGRSLLWGLLHPMHLGTGCSLSMRRATATWLGWLM